MTDETSRYFDRHVEFAEHPERFKGMVTAFRVAESSEEMQKVSMMYVFDMSYSRADISLALKTVEYEKGWRGL